jgi:undecaprenyl-diphosphatase
MSAEEAAGLNPSFPSGHAMMSATVYLTLAVLVGHYAERRFVRLYLTGVAMILTLLIGLSRIYIGDHWFTDVLGGWCVGCAWALVWWGVALALERLAPGKLTVRNPAAT